MIASIISARQWRFQAEDRSFTDVVLEQRLLRAHWMLMDPVNAGQSISWIAFGAGFNDLSCFNGTFRRRYGATPFDVRKTARAEDGSVA
jgi:transcriptional regulator GlxA family with amidase domain